MIGTNNAEGTGWALKGFCSLILFSLIGCAVGPDFVRPKPPTVDRYTSGAQPVATITADGQAQAVRTGCQDRPQIGGSFLTPQAGCSDKGGHRQQSDPAGSTGEFAPKPGVPPGRLRSFLSPA